MQPIITHPWDLDEKSALEIQESLSRLVTTNDQFDNIHFIAGVDVAYCDHKDTLVAAVVILDSDSLNIVESVVIEDKCYFPYIPGLFSFREIPPVTKALNLLKIKPDLFVCDGHGLAHPRRFGLACHLGVLYDTPSIGCGKTRLIGEFGNLGEKRGDYSPLLDNDEVVGHVLRTQDNIKPVFVSIGNKISLTTASDWILKVTPKYRLPETTRQADQLVRKSLRI
ncbi:deoxyribonuclease V [Thermoactinomyces sp. DSM 45892]|uniref:deoxyribonuclease V n=1 Tax=Thermoactinomyces sp. DSM 45892 TaxID=1882753 RepID=UPI0008960B69|nr:deoxyribonuclease V [Thermoactinomyces sp. DSM 45892]SDZ34473.1 Endonuclease V [Thermoactinomyces sp. DSM 45892]